MTPTAAATVTSTRSVTRDPFHKAAIALNNTAVSLLVRGCGKEACATLDDALNLMECAATFVPYARNTGMNDHDTSLAAIQGALDRASQRTSTSHRCCNHPLLRGGGVLCQGTTSSNTPTITTSTTTSGTPSSGPTRQPCYSNSDWPTLQVISTQDNPTRIFERLTSCTDTTSLHVAFPMTIDILDYESTLCTRNEVFFEAAVMVYNYGVVQHCMAHSHLSPPTDTLPPRQRYQQQRQQQHPQHHYSDASLRSQVVATTGTGTSWLSSPHVTPFANAPPTPCVVPATASSAAAIAPPPMLEYPTPPLATGAPIMIESLQGDATTTVASPNLARKAFAVFQWATGTLAQIRLDAGGDGITTGTNDASPPPFDEDTVTQFTLSCQIVLLRLVLNHTMLNLAIALRWDTEYFTYSYAMSDLLRTIEVHQYFYCPLLDNSAAAAAA